MSVEDRLFALAQQCRQQSGDAFLTTPGQLAPRLNSQAPDLHAEIRALAAAFELNAAGRIAAAADAEAEAAAIGSEIAARERLAMASVQPAVAVARRVGPLASSSPGAAASSGGWAGDSMVVGAGTPASAPAPHVPPVHQPQPQPYPQPQAAPTASNTDKLKALSKNPWVLGAAAVVGGFLIYQNFMSRPAAPDMQQPPPVIGGQTPVGGQTPIGGQPPIQPPVTPGGTTGPGGMQPPVNPPPGGGGGGGAPPALQQPGAGGPALQVQQHPSGAPGFLFTMATPRGQSAAMVLLPNGGWQSGPVMLGIAAPGDTTGQQMAAMGQGQFQLVQSGGHPVRLAQIQMAQDNLGIGGACVMFRGQQGQQDVQLSGSDFCVMDAPCSRPIGCGRIQ